MDDNDLLGSGGPDLLDDDDDEQPDPRDGFKKAKYGGAAAILAGILGAVAVFLFAPPIPLGGWAVYVRALVSLVAFGISAAIVWFLTVVTIMGDM
jgi:hypothetical protein